MKTLSSQAAHGLLPLSLNTCHKAGSSPPFWFCCQLAAGGGEASVHDCKPELLSSLAVKMLRNPSASTARLSAAYLIVSQLQKTSSASRSVRRRRSPTEKITTGVQPCRLIRDRIHSHVPLWKPWGTKRYVFNLSELRERVSGSVGWVLLTVLC